MSKYDNLWKFQKKFWQNPSEFLGFKKKYNFGLVKTSVMSRLCQNLWRQSAPVLKLSLHLTEMPIWLLKLLKLGTDM